MSDCVALKLADLLATNVLSKDALKNNKEESAKVEGLITAFREIGEANKTKEVEVDTETTSTGYEGILPWETEQEFTDRTGTTIDSNFMSEFKKDPKAAIYNEIESGKIEAMNLIMSNMDCKG
jgi:hypothetical protein